MTTVAAVTVTYLELDGGSDTRDKHVVHPSGTESATLLPGITVQRERAPQAAGLAAEMYRRVGADWHWVDRRGWTAADWCDAIHRDDVEVWTARRDDEPIGYYELYADADADAVDIRYFGVIPRCTGKRIGGPLLAMAIGRAVAMGRGRVTVNTCTLDHPAALPNYLARGFRVVRTETQHRTLAR